MRNREWSRRYILVVHIGTIFLIKKWGTDNVAVTTAVTEKGTKSFNLVQRVIDIKTEEVKCICTSVMVYFDLEKHESKPLSEEFIEAICNYEGRNLRKIKS